MPANTMLATTDACARPARKCPTSTREKSTSCWLMPPADISDPARMKNGSASSVYESSCAKVFCANSGSTMPGSAAMPMKPTSAMHSRIGMPISIRASSTPSITQITART